MTSYRRYGRSAGSERSTGSVERLNAHLRARLGEIEAAVLARVFAVSDPENLDPVYAEGLKAAVSAAVEYGLNAVELRADGSLPPPLLLLAQARLAARNGVGLDTVLRRYVAGHSLVTDFLVEEAERDASLGSSTLQSLLRAQAALLERLLATVSEAYTSEQKSTSGKGEQLRIERLLRGEPTDTGGLGYDLEGHHLGAIAHGPAAPELVDEIASGLGHPLLEIEPEDGTVWAWFGGDSPVSFEQLARLASPLLGATRLATGEPTRGLDGWRLTHRQAKAALAVALRGTRAAQPTRYGEVALLAMALADETLAAWMTERYLAPLAGTRDGGEALLETLRAYFSANRSIASAATELSTSRSTVASRLRTAEERLGPCSTELEIAIRLKDLDHRENTRTTHDKSAT